MATTDSIQQHNLDLITEFCLQVEVGSKTRERYRRHLTYFTTWLMQTRARDVDLLETSPADVHRFMGRLRSSGAVRDEPLSASTRKSYLASLRGFFRYLLLVRLIVHDPTHGIRPPRVTPTRGLSLTAAQLRQLLDTDGSARERIQTYLLVFTAARSGEIRRLRWQDVDLPNRAITLHGKRDARRTIAIHPELMSELRRWSIHQDREAERNELIRQARSDPDTDFVLLTSTGRQLSASAIYKQVKRRASHAGLFRLEPAHREHRSLVSPHALRRSFATLLLNQGEHLDAVSDVLGHASVDTTRRHYAFSSPARQRTTIEAFKV